MNADELLKMALEELEIHGDRSTWFLIEEIRTYLNAPKNSETTPSLNDAISEKSRASCIENAAKYTCSEEPVAWIQPDQLQKAQSQPFLCRVEPKQREDFIPIYLHPPRPMKPMTVEECLKAWGVTKQYGHTDRPTFIAGIRFAERHHGISGGSDE